MILFPYMNEATGSGLQPPPKDTVQKQRLVDQEQPVRGVILGKELALKSCQMAAGVLHIKYNQDGPPIAAKLKQEGKIPLTLLAVTDGLGGAGYIEETVNKHPDRLHTEAWIGAQTATQAVLDLYKSMQEGAFR